jgi:hypothetical protein
MRVAGPTALTEEAVDEGASVDRRLPSKAAHLQADSKHQNIVSGALPFL